MHTTLGPAAPEATPPLTPARARVLAELADVAEWADTASRTTLAALAERLGGHPNATRQHLDALVAAGLATVAAASPTGRGRPAQSWAITPDGRRALARSGAGDAWAELVDALASHLADRPDAAEQARAIGRAWGQRRADGAELVEVLDDLGFAPEVEPVDPSTLRLLACPILAAARAHPEVICAIHAGLVEGTLAARGVGGGVRLVPFAEPGACLVTRVP